MKMLANLQSLIVAIALTLGCITSYADQIIHEGCGVEFWIPEEWHHEIADDILIIEDSESQLKLFFLTSGLQVLDQISDTLLEELSRVVTQPEVTSTSRLGEHNELLYYSAQGFGLYEREIIDWELRFVAGPRKSLMIIALGNLDSHRQTVEEIYQTIHLTKSDPEDQDQIENQ